MANAAVQPEVSSASGARSRIPSSPQGPQGEPRLIVPLVDQINSGTLQLVDIAHRRETFEQVVVPSHGSAEN
jgi:hypothetical protein